MAPQLSLGSLQKRLARLEHVVQNHNKIHCALQPNLGWYWSRHNDTGRLTKALCFVSNYHPVKKRVDNHIVTVMQADIVALHTGWSGGLYQRPDVSEYVVDVLAEDKDVEEARKADKFEFVFDLPAVLELMREMEEPEAPADDSKGATAA